MQINTSQEKDVHIETDINELERQFTILQAQMEASRDGIIVADIEGNLILHNQRFFEMWQIPAHHFIAADNHKRLAMVIERMKNPTESVIKIWSIMARPKKNSRDEIELADGRYVDRYTTPILDRNGQIIGRVWFHRDITELKKIQEELQEYNYYLEQQVRTRTTELEKLYYDLRAKEMRREQQCRQLAEKNKQLRKILYYMENNKEYLQKKIQSNIINAILPFIEMFKNTSLSNKQKKILNNLLSLIKNLIDNTDNKKNILIKNLSPTEFQIALNIRDGKNSKEISSILSCSTRTVEGHRYSIRKKLCLKKRENLQLHLRSLLNKNNCISEK